MYDTKIGARGEIFSYRENEYNLDQINPGKTLFLLYKKYRKEKYRAAIEKLMSQLHSQPRTKAGGFWHKQIYPWQMWLDGLYMQGPFYARYASEYGNGADFDDLAHQFTLMESKARDSETGLLYHAWDESREQLWANPDTGCSPHFWGRAIGWYCMALVDTLEFIPPSHTEQAEALTAIARRLVAPLLKYQDARSGLWYQVMDRLGAELNYLESSASCMFIYFLFKIIRLDKKLNLKKMFNPGLVPETDTEAVKSAAVKAYRGLLEQRVQEDSSGELHLTGTCKVAGLGGTPYRDGSYEYYVNEPQGADDFKGVGSFILASMEYEDILK
jgi:unsaturated rhamnogalacturonyl hydrolase